MRNKQSPQSAVEGLSFPVEYYHSAYLLPPSLLLQTKPIGVFEETTSVSTFCLSSEQISPQPNFSQALLRSIVQRLQEKQENKARK